MILISNRALFWACATAGTLEIVFGLWFMTEARSVGEFMFCAFAVVLGMCMVPVLEELLD